VKNAARRAKKANSFELAQLQKAFDALPKKYRRAFVNAVTSDQGPENPKLGNRAPQRNAPIPPTSGMGGFADGNDWDYFRNTDGKMVYRDQPQDSITPARVTLSVRMRTNPIRGLTPERVVQFMDQWRFGFFRQAGMMWDQMQRRDYQLKIAAPKRCKSVARHGYDVLIVENLQEGQKAMAQEQQSFLKGVYDHVTATNALEPDETGGFGLLTRQMMDAHLKRYAVHDMVWQPKPDGSLTFKFIFCPVWWFEGTRGKLRFLDSEFQIYGRDMLPGEWLVTVGEGLMEAISLVYTLKWLALKSWVQLLDKFGQPGIHGKTDATKGSKEWNDFVSAVQEFSQEWAAVTNRSGEITLVEAKSTTGGVGPFEPLVDRMDRVITQLLRGGDLGTTSGQNKTGASLQEDESEILETDDSKIIEETLTAQVSRPALDWKFGPDTPQLVYLKLRTTPRRNLQDDIAVDEFLLNAGAPLAVEDTLERYSRSMPEKGATLLKPIGQLGQKTAPNGQPLPPSKTDANSEFANTANLEASGKELLIEAILAEFRGVNARLAAIQNISDPEMQKQKLADVLTELDKLEANINHDPAVARAIYKILAAGCGNGIAEAAMQHEK
jgi:phage gp29-like protein